MNCTSESQTFKIRGFRRWKKKSNNIHENALFWNGIFSDDDYSNGSSDEDNDSSSGLKLDHCGSTNELRIFVGTWNVGGRSPLKSLSVDLHDWLDLKNAADIYVLGFQEIVPLKTRHVIGAEDRTEATNWNRLVGNTLNDKYGCHRLASVSTTSAHKRTYPNNASRMVMERCTSMRDYAAMEGSRYQLMATKKLVGVLISVWMRKELVVKYSVSNAKVSSVGCGIMGYLGNKGSVSVSMTIGGTSYCFVAAHLASGEKKGDETRRNHQVSEIFKRTAFPSSAKEGEIIRSPTSILDHDRVFWFGDLNYRLYLEDSLARHLIQKEDWKGLQEFDQLRRELEDGGAFEGWQEGNIEFAPTYKYSVANCYRYSGGHPGRAGEKQRTPAWCDRILWYGKGVKQLYYVRSESKFSDHRPVSALFSISIEVKNGGPAGPIHTNPCIESL